MTEDQFPALCRSAETTSAAAQRKFLLALGGNAVCLVLAAIMSAINLKYQWFFMIQTLMLLVSLILSIYLSYENPQKIWYGARALSESIKTITWRYVMRAEPYNIGDSEARYHFILNLQKIFNDNKNVTATAVADPNADHITEEMEKIRRENLTNRKKYYRNNRIDEQKKWYTNKSISNKERSKYWFFALFSANGLAILFSVFRGMFPDKDIWPTDVFVAVSGSILAWVQTKKYQELAASYALTAHEIGLVAALQPNEEDEEKFSVFVGDAENAFSREHTQWQARRDRD